MYAVEVLKDAIRPLRSILIPGIDPIATYVASACHLPVRLYGEVWL